MITVVGVICVRGHTTTARVNVADDCLHISTVRRSCYETCVSNAGLLKKIAQSFSNLKMITVVGVISERGHITTARVNVADDCLHVSTLRRSCYETCVSNVRLLKKIAQNFSNLKMITVVGVICARPHKLM